MSIRENPAVSTLLNVVPSGLKPRADGPRVFIEHADRTWTIRPIWIGEGFPADVHRALKARTDETLGEITMLAARRMSRASRELLEGEGVSWVDTDGYAEIRGIPGLYISRLKPVKPAKWKTMTWTPAVAATAEVILEWRWRHGAGIEGGDGLLVHRARWISERTGVSYAQTSRILSTFDDEGYTAKVGAERGPTSLREFRDAGRLLSDWAAYYTRASGPERGVQFHVPWRSPQLSLDAIEAAVPNTDWLVSGAIAADRVASHLTQVGEVLVYVARDEAENARQALASNPDFTEVDSGGRVLLHAGESYLFELSKVIDGVRVAPAVRVYGDLLRARGRFAEAAEFLRDTAIGF